RVDIMIHRIEHVKDYKNDNVKDMRKIHDGFEPDGIMTVGDTSLGIDDKIQTHLTSDDIAT
ncbi:10232_t:CDS:2, partial [Cetraspora pellucida]